MVRGRRPIMPSNGRSISAVRNDLGSTRAWRELRESFAVRLPLPCWRCGRQVDPDPPDLPPGVPSGWHLGHVGLSRADGANDEHVWPEHARCSESAGGRDGARRVNGPGPGRGLGPSREWL